MTLKYVYKGPKPLRVATVCGVGQGSSLIMKMFVEDVMKELGIPAKVESMEIVTAKAANSDVIFCSILHVNELKSAAKIVIGLKSLIDKKEMKSKLIENLVKAGMLETT